MADLPVNNFKNVRKMPKGLSHGFRSRFSTAIFYLLTSSGLGTDLTFFVLCDLRAAVS